MYIYVYIYALFPPYTHVGSAYTLFICGEHTLQRARFCGHSHLWMTLLPNVFDRFSVVVLRFQMFFIAVLRFLSFSIVFNRLVNGFLVVQLH